MVIYLFGGKDPFDFPLTDKERRELLKDAEFNFGLSVVMDVKDILEFLEIPPVKEAQRRSVEARLKRLGI